MTAHFVDRPLVEAIDSIIGTPWREIRWPLPPARQQARIRLYNSDEYLDSMELKREMTVGPERDPRREAVARASDRFITSGLFRALKADMYRVEVTPVGARGLSGPTLPNIFLPAAFWVSAHFLIERDPPRVFEHLSLRQWASFANPIVRWPPVAEESATAQESNSAPGKRTEPVADKRSRRSTGSLQMEEALVALLAAERRFSSQADARNTVLKRLGVKDEAHGYGRGAFAPIWEKLVKGRP
jgi:hypothetical protein